MGLLVLTLIANATSYAVVSSSVPSESRSDHPRGARVEEHHGAIERGPDFIHGEPAGSLVEIPLCVGCIWMLRTGAPVDHPYRMGSAGGECRSRSHHTARRSART